ncbi:hypothetical protein [Vibrio sp. Hal054]|uniref:hypothetical protein n=1 Tax=Vibrio sp. Hal054 TaxID=3035158 RepID=UPI00301BD2B5
MKHQLRKNLVTVALSASVFYTGSAYAIVCTDPAGNALQIQEMVKDAGLWVQEKGMMLTQMAQDKAMSLYETYQSEYNASAGISSVTTAISSTENAASEERYTTSASACDTLNRSLSIVNSFSDSCENPVTEAFFSNEQDQITDCSLGGSGLNCGRVQARRQQIATAVNDAVENKDGRKLLNILSGEKLLGLSDQPMLPADEKEHMIALSLLLGVEDPTNLPRAANGAMLDISDENSAKELSYWARRHLLRSVPNAALTRVYQLYSPDAEGNASTMARIKDQVDYYTSEQFIKLITNTNDKSSLPSGWDTASPAEKHAYNQKADISKRITSSHEVTRYIAEMMSLSLRMQSIDIETNLNSNSMLALQLKETRQ